MAFDFTTQQNYFINYPSLLKELLSRPSFFNNEENRYLYLSTWVKNLQNHGQLLENNFSTPQQKLELYKSIEKEPEIFQQVLDFNTNKIYLHFRISQLKDLLKRNTNPNIPIVSIDEFTGDSPSYHWSYPDDMKANSIVSSEPIVAVEFPTNISSFLVIDGNHRIADAIQKDKRNIPCITLGTREVKEHLLTASSFDLQFLIFNNEIANLGNKKSQENLTDEQLLGLSYLSTGTWNF